jgi:hypothetical protein
MTLTQARRFAVSKKTQIEFAMQGTPCLIDEHGVARLPGNAGPVAFTFTDAFEQAAQFTLTRGAHKQSLSRQALAELAGTPVAVAHDEDE